MSKSRNIFIVGRPRSGTTLFLRLLDGHRDIITINSETAIYRLENLRNRMDDSEQRFLHLVGRPYDFKNNKAQKYETIIERNSNWQKRKFFADLMQYHPDPEKCVTLLKDASKSGSAKALLTLFKLHSEAFKSGQISFYLVEKTPSHEYNIKRIYQDFPDAIFIHVFRDPFSVIASRSASKKPRDYTDEALYWRNSVKIYMKSKIENPDNHIKVIFEELVNDTGMVMRDISNKLGISFDESLLTPTENNGSVLWKSHAHRNVKPRDGTVDPLMQKRDVVNELDKKDLRRIGIWVGCTYKKLGYNSYIEYTSRYKLSEFLSVTNWSLLNLIKYIRNILLDRSTMKLHF